MALNYIQVGARYRNPFVDLSGNEVNPIQRPLTFTPMSDDEIERNIKLLKDTKLVKGNTPVISDDAINKELSHISQNLNAKILTNATPPLEPLPGAQHRPLLSGDELVALNSTELEDYVRQMKEILFNYRPQEIKDLLGIKYDGPIRKLLEPMGAQRQCESSEVKFHDPTKPFKPNCWLCGCPIEDGDAHCEHIIPALRAIMLKGMSTTDEVYNSDRFQNKINNKQALDRITKNNYLWAHSSCNISPRKGSMVLITWDGTQFVPDEAKIAQLTAAILKQDMTKGGFDKKTREPTGWTGYRNCYGLSLEPYPRGFANKNGGITYAKGQGVVSSVYDVIEYEITKQCQDINHDMETIYASFTTDGENKSPVQKQKTFAYMATQALSKIRMYLTKRGVDALLSDKERRAQQAAAAAAAAETEEIKKQELINQLVIIYEELKDQNQTFFTAQDYFLSEQKYIQDLYRDYSGIFKHPTEEEEKTLIKSSLARYYKDNLYGRLGDSDTITEMVDEIHSGNAGVVGWGIASREYFNNQKIFDPPLQPEASRYLLEAKILLYLRNKLGDRIKSQLVRPNFIGTSIVKGDKEDFDPKVNQAEYREAQEKEEEIYRNFGISRKITNPLELTNIVIDRLSDFVSGATIALKLRGRAVALPENLPFYLSDTFYINKNTIDDIINNENIPGPEKIHAIQSLPFDDAAFLSDICRAVSNYLGIFIHTYASEIILTDEQINNFLPKLDFNQGVDNLKVQIDQISQITVDNLLEKYIKTIIDKIQLLRPTLFENLNNLLQINVLPICFNDDNLLNSSLATHIVDAGDLIYNSEGVTLQTKLQSLNKQNFEQLLKQQEQIQLTPTPLSTQANTSKVSKIVKKMTSRGGPRSNTPRLKSHSVNTSDSRAEQRKNSENAVKDARAEAQKRNRTGNKGGKRKKSKTKLKIKKKLNKTIRRRKNKKNKKIKSKKINRRYLRKTIKKRKRKN